MAKLGDVIRPAKVVRCNDKQYPILSMTMHDGIVLQSNRFKKSLASVDQSNYKVVNYGQLVVGFPIDEGVLYIQKVIPKGIMSPAYNIWDINYEIVDPDYLEFCLHSPQSMQYYKDNLRGTTARRRSIPTDTLLKLPIYLPSLDKQRKIATALNKVNNLIAKRQAQLDKLDLLVKARFVEMFGDPKINEKGWKTAQISDVFDVKGGKRIPKGMGYSDIITNHPYLRVSDMKNGTILDEDIHYITEEVFEKIKRYTVAAGDIYLTNVGVNLGMAGVIPEKYNGANLTENAVKLVPHKHVLNGKFLAYYINSPGIQDYINERKMVVGVPKLAIFRIETMPIIIPPMEEQECFVRFVDYTSNVKLKIQMSLTNLETLSEALMQKCFE